MRAALRTLRRDCAPVYRYYPAVQEPEMLDRPRGVHHADVLLDSNVLRANDDAAEKRLHALTDLLVAYLDQGHVWFSLMSLSEVVAAGSPELRIELLKRFQNLYVRFGERVRFMRSLSDNIRAECTGGKFPWTYASTVDGDIAKSIAAGDVVRLLKEGHDDWRAEKKRLREKYHKASAKRIVGITWSGPSSVPRLRRSSRHTS